MGDGTVLTGVMRQMHRRFPTMPFYIVGKEISVEDVRLCLEKMPDRLFEHPATVLVVTNMHYSEAPSLQPRSMQAAATLNWMEIPLSGNTSHEFHEQIGRPSAHPRRHLARAGEPQDRQPALRPGLGAGALPRGITGSCSTR